MGEDVWQLVGRDAHAAVAHGDDGRLVVVAHRHVDRRALGAILDRVADDVLHHAFQPRPVARDDHRSRHVQRHQCGSPRPARVQHGVGYCAHQLAHVHQIDVQGEGLAHLELRRIGDLLHRGHHAPDRAVDGRHVCVEPRPVQGAAIGQTQLDQLYAAVDGRQRCA